LLEPGLPQDYPQTCTLVEPIRLKMDSAQVTLVQSSQNDSQRGQSAYTPACKLTSGLLVHLDHDSSTTDSTEGPWSEDGSSSEASIRMRWLYNRDGCQEQGPLADSSLIVTQNSGDTSSSSRQSLRAKGRSVLNTMRKVPGPQGVPCASLPACIAKKTPEPGRLLTKGPLLGREDKTGKVNPESGFLEEEPVKILVSEPQRGPCASQSVLDELRQQDAIFSQSGPVVYRLSL